MKLSCTDVGLFDSSTIADTPVYIAPEVFHSQIYVYGTKADIYSLGIMLWEMWYGQQAFAGVTAEVSTAVFFSLVEGGTRPKHVDGCKNPYDFWEDLMEKCWQTNPEERPTAQQCYEAIRSLSVEVFSSPQLRGFEMLSSS